MGFAAGRSAVTAAAVEGAFLEPGMEARARNLQQFDPSPEADSLLEQLRVHALRLPRGEDRDRILDLVDEVIASNSMEAEAELAISRDADRLVADLRHMERNGAGAAITSKAVARAAQPALSCLTHLDVASMGEIEKSNRVLRELTDTVPRLMLLGNTVRYELGERKFAVLEAFVNKMGAGGSTPTDAHERKGARRGQH